MKLKDRVALVTGGSRGIGRAIVESLAREGAKVAFVYNSNADAANAVVAALDGCDVDAYQADVRDKQAADKVVEQVIEKWGKIDILVNNAGIIRDGLLATMDVDQWQDVIDTNLTSVASEVSNPGQANYAASKGGVEGFTKCVATELARRGITANAVAPGFIETDMTEAVVNAAGKEIKKRIPARRLGQPEDIANAVLFLASDESSYVTGQVIRVDGGLTLGGM